jgi:hypothetical protein
MNGLEVVFFYFTEENRLLKNESNENLKGTISSTDCAAARATGECKAF